MSWLVSATMRQPNQPAVLAWFSLIHYSDLIDIPQYNSTVATVYKDHGVSHLYITQKASYHTRNTMLEAILSFKVVLSVSSPKCYKKLTNKHKVILQSRGIIVMRSREKRASHLHLQIFQWTVWYLIQCISCIIEIKMSTRIANCRCG